MDHQSRPQKRSGHVHVRVLGGGAIRILRIEGEEALEAEPSAADIAIVSVLKFIPERHSVAAQPSSHQQVELRHMRELQGPETLYDLLGRQGRLRVGAIHSAAAPDARSAVSVGPVYAKT